MERRADVLTFTSAPLEAAVEVVGEVRLVLYAHSSCAHTDFVGRLCEASRDGRASTNICDGMIRVGAGGGGVRGSNTCEQLEGCWRLSFSIGVTAYRFEPGHRIRLQVCSGAHPRWRGAEGDWAGCGH